MLRRFLGIHRLWLAAAVAGVVLGSAVGIAVGQRGSTEGAPGPTGTVGSQATEPATEPAPAETEVVTIDDFNAAYYPDGRIDVCVQFMPGAKEAALDGVDVALGRIGDTPLGREQKIDGLAKGATAPCSAKPPYDLAADDTASTSRDIHVDKQGPFDLYLFVYPQSLVDEKLGMAWDVRITWQEYPANGRYVQAVFIGDNEFGDVALLQRFVQRGLGAAGPIDSRRPLIDNECTTPDNPERCSPDVFATIDPKTETTPTP